MDEGNGNITTGGKVLSQNTVMIAGTTGREEYCRVELIHRDVRPEDAGGILRISMGGQEGTQPGFYCVYRGDVEQIKRCLSICLQALLFSLQWDKGGAKGCGPVMCPKCQHQDSPEGFLTVAKPNHPDRNKPGISVVGVGFACPKCGHEFGFP